MTTQSISVEDLQKTLDDIEGEARPSAIAPAANAPASPTQAANPLYLRDFVNADQLRRDVHFNVNDLDDAICSHAGLYVHYADLARQARRQHERMKVTAEVMESRLRAVHREAFVAAGVKATVDQIDVAVKTDPRWYAAQQKLIDARAIMDLAVDAREAFQQRKDMLIQVSVDRRREREGELRIGNGQPAAQRNQDAREGVLAHLSSQRTGT